jgi:hypothetical protein
MPLGSAAMSDTQSITPRWGEIQGGFEVDFGLVGL